jgi:tRNA A-37 threonylcarbamoyl transferase component Bud32
VPRIVGDRYELDRELGHGGMAEVFLARDRLLHRDVAIKILYKHLTRDDEGRLRFMREARATAGLRHPNVVEIHDFSGGDSEEMYLVTEYIRGQNLKELIDAARPAHPEVGAMFVHQVLEGLDVAHGRGIIHRDIKPENVMIREDGVVKLMDFGIARMAGVESFTQTDVLVGSPLYMAPEQIGDGEVDPRVDVFAAGIVLYYTVTGELPFNGETAPQVMRRICKGVYTAPDRHCAAVAGDLVRIIAKALATLPDERYQSAVEMRDALAGFLSESGVAHPDAELTAYLEDPEAWDEAYARRLVPLLLARGRERFAAHRHAQGMDAFNRVLSIEPDNEEVRRFMRRDERRRRLLRAARQIGLGALVVLIVVGGLVLGPRVVDRLQRTRPLNWSGRLRPVLRLLEPLRPSHPPRAALGMVPSARGRHGIDLALTPVLPDRARLRPGSGAAEARKATWPVSIMAFPPAVEIAVDGVRCGSGRCVDQPLTAGEHKVTLTHPTCEVCLETRYKIQVDQRDGERPPYRFPIRYRPALLRFKGPPGGQVFVGGALKGTSDRPVKVSLTRPGETRLELQVRWPDHEVKRSVRVRAGQTVDVDLR